MKKQLHQVLLGIGILSLSVLRLKSFSIDPKKEYILTPDSVGVKYESLTIRTSDGYDLSTWIYQPKEGVNNDTVLILAYPDKNNMSYWVYYAATFALRGYTVVTFDYRGFGQSADFPVNPSFEYHTEFIDDLVAVARETDNRFSHGKIGVWALSMGTIIVTRAINHLKGNIDFIVGEGFVTDVEKVVDRIEKVKHNNVVLPENSRKYQKSLKRLTVPLLIFAASDDVITTKEDAIDLQKKKASCQVVIYEGYHLRGFQAGEGPFGQFYIDEIDKFLASAFDR